MSVLARIDYSKRAYDDINRLNEFLDLNDSPLKGKLAAFITNAASVLSLQPGIGRPVSNGYRELIIHRGRSGYLVRYRHDKKQQTITILRIRHQNESGYTLDEI